jgi:hypothetical protein
LVPHLYFSLIIRYPVMASIISILFCFCIFRIFFELWSKILRKLQYVRFGFYGFGCISLVNIVNIFYRGRLYLSFFYCWVFIRNWNCIVIVMLLRFIWNPRNGSLCFVYILLFWRLWMRLCLRLFFIIFFKKRAKVKM